MGDGHISLLLVIGDDSRAQQAYAAFAAVADRFAAAVARTLRDVAFLADSPLDLVIADVELPDGSGLDLLPSATKAVACPVLIVLPPGDERGPQALAAGAVDYACLGPADFAGLPYAAERALELWRLRRECRTLEWREDRLRTVFTRAALGIIRVDASGRFLEANPAFVALLGYSVEALLTKRVADVTYPADWPREEQLTRALATGVQDVVRLEKRFVRSDGRPAWSSVTLSAVRDQCGRLDFSIGIVENITVRKNSERLLSLLYTALEQADETVAITDVDGKVQYVNEAFVRLTGYSRQEAMGQDLSILKSGRHDAAFYQELWDTIRRGETWRGELENRRKDGALYREECTITPVKDPTGETSSYVCVKRDQTRQRDDEEEVRRAHRMEAVGALAAGMAHGFSNLVSPILGYADKLLASLPRNSPLRADMVSLRCAAGRAADLTRQLQAFSCSQALERKAVRVDAVVQEFAQALGRVIGDDVRVVTHLAAGDGRASLDVPKLQHALMNLALNARAAMPRGGVLTLETTCTTADSAYAALHRGIAPGDYVAVVVSDTGHGMDAATRARVFEPFFSTRDPDKAVGMGLSVVYGVVRQHQGFIWVYSEPGLGTSFKIYLPRLPDAVPAAAAEAVPAPGQAPARPERADRVERERAERATVLVVEDEEGIRKFLCDALAMRGYTVVSAEDGPAALRLLADRKLSVDLLLTDIVMPGMNGAEVHARVAAVCPGVRVLFMSGYTANVNVQEGRLAPDADFIQKPFGLQDILAKVSAVLRRPVAGAAVR